MITDFGGLLAILAERPLERICVAGGDDSASLAFVAEALERGFVRGAAVSGDRDRIRAGLSAGIRDRVACLGDGDPAELSRRAVAALERDSALMKGRVDSASYLRAALDDAAGLRTGSILSNVTLAAMPSYPKFLAATDNGLVASPDLAQKRQILGNAVTLVRGIGLEKVRVAVLAASEKVTSRQPATVDARALAEDGQRGLWPGAVVDGPMGYDAAISPEAARIKGLEGSLVAGCADLLLFPSIEGANAVVKAWKYHGQADTGSIVVGARAPVLLNSRSDGPRKRLNALALSVAWQGGPRPSVDALATATA
jgi:phosphate butyryltransferase